VGIGGHATQGGVGVSTGEWGLAVDNMVSATVVLANGGIVKASETENADLFWGIRGGGPNFGIVAEFAMRLHEQRPDVFTTLLEFTAEQLPSFVDAVNEFRNVQSPKEGLVMAMQYDPEGKLLPAVVGWRNSSEDDGERAFKRFQELKPVNTIKKQVPYTDTTWLFEQGTRLPGDKAFVGAYIDRFDMESVQKACDKLQATTGSLLLYEFHHYQKLSEVPVDATAYFHRTTNIICLLMSHWTDPKDTQQMYTNLFELRDIVMSTSSPPLRGLCYPNYADILFGRGGEEEAKLLFGSNYVRLQEVKRKYDPGCVWKGWFPIRPAA